jgi:hypothetical protein
LIGKCRFYAPDAFALGGQQLPRPLSMRFERSRKLFAPSVAAGGVAILIFQRAHKPRIQPSCGASVTASRKVAVRTAARNAP